TQNGDLKNESTITGFQNANISGDTENIGTITGTGFGSQYIFDGNLTNQQGGSISEIDSLIIEKKFENYGTLKIFGNMQVHGGFTNGSSELNEDGSTTYTGGDIYIVYQNGVFGETSVTGGDAVINGGNLYLSGDRLTVGQNYLFLTVHGEGNELIVNQPFEILPDSEMIPKLFHAEGFYNDTEYWVSLRRDFEYGPAGSTPNQISTGTYLDKIAYTLNTQEDYENNDLFRVLSALDDISANSELGAASDEVHLALDRMSGTIFANMNLMTLQNGWQVHQNLANIIRPMDCPFNECDHPEQRFSNAWGSFLGNTGQVDSDGNSYGFNYDSAGLIVGYDFFRSRGFRSGAYFQYVNANMNERETMADAEIDNYDLGLYALLRNEWGYLSASGNFGYSNYDTTRRVAFGGPNDWIDRTHYGRTYSTQQSLRVESAGEFAFWENRFLLRPFAGLTYVRMQMDDLEEHSRDGNDYVTELNSSFDDLNSLRSELGARLSFCWKNDRRCLGMNLRASWVHEFCDTQVMIENKFTHPVQDPPDYMFSDTSSSFLITGTDLGEDYAWIGFGMTLDTGSFWTLFGGYDGLLNGSTTLHPGNLGISFSW
ncbi:MAG: autotransporter domain-containing protein, partial [Planctomycetia bacterium]|nr:autotransporter domain-containing protein [Planctomycetia bacterium]